MSMPSTRIPIDHHPAVHAIDTSVSTSTQASESEDATPFTLLELIDAVSEVSDNEQEVIATVQYMLNSGRVQLTGSFRDEPVEKLCG